MSLSYEQQLQHEANIWGSERRMQMTENFTIEQRLPSGDMTGNLAHQMALARPILHGPERLLSTTVVSVPAGQVVYARK